MFQQSFEHLLYTQISTYIIIIIVGSCHVICILYTRYTVHQMHTGNSHRFEPNQTIQEN